jgi:hypothetical protein
VGKLICASTFFALGQLKAGRPGNELTPAEQGVIRVPSGGRLLSGALVRMMIQCALSQALAGRVNFPLKVAPACKLMVSPQFALFSAVCKLPPAGTKTVLPGAGEFAIVLCT